MHSDIKIGWLGNAIVVYNVIATVHLRIHNMVSNKNIHYCVSRYIFNAKTIHNCMQLKLRYFLEKKLILSNEIKMQLHIMLHTSCDYDEMVSGATGGELDKIIYKFILFCIFVLIICQSIIGLHCKS